MTSSRLRKYSIDTTEHTECPQKHRAVLVEKPSVSLCRFCASVVSSRVFQHPARTLRDVRYDKTTHWLLVVCFIATSVSALPRCANADQSSCAPRQHASCGCDSSSRQNPGCRVGCMERSTTIRVAGITQPTTTVRVATLAGVAHTSATIPPECSISTLRSPASLVYAASPPRYLLHCTFRL